MGTNSLTGEMLPEPFLLPGNIWQLICFVARQHDDMKFSDVTQSVKVLKQSRCCTNGEPSAVVCTGFNERVDAALFKYSFSFVPESRDASHEFKPWRDMNRLVQEIDSRGDVFEWYYVC